MCSVDDVNDNTDRLHLDSGGREISTVCVKCKARAASVVIRCTDSFCRDCFLVFCSHKFRSSFGKSKVVRDGEQVIVAYSGGIASAAMLHLVQEGKSCRAQKKLRFSPHVVFVDEGAALGLSVNERTEQNRTILKLMSASGYPCCIVLLEQVMACPVNGDSHLPTTREMNFTDTADYEYLSKETLMLQHLMQGIRTPTAKEYMLKSLRSKLLTRTAIRLGCSKVITGETSTRLSVNMLAGIALGRGAHIPFDTALIDSRNETVIVVRPMRDFTAKEATMYNVLQAVESHFTPNLTTMGKEGETIESLTESFVLGLQSNFPATVSTVVRTGDKLADAGAVAKIEPSDDHALLPLSPALGCQPSAVPAVSNESNTCSSGYCSAADGRGPKRSRSLCGMCEAPTDNTSVLGVGYSAATAPIDWGADCRGMLSAELLTSLCYACQRTMADVVSSHSVLHNVLRTP